MEQDFVSAAQRRAARTARRWRIGIAVVLVVLAVAYLGASVSIGLGVRSICETALQAFPGDRVLALMQLVESDRHGVRDRNRAIWALGQLGDPRALPLLRRHFTGGESDERTELSQYELKKAIALCEGATNISAFVWRRGVMATRGES
jgi:PBS lyase HEAT-like repeat